MSDNFVICPNLPQSRVKLVAVSGKYPHISAQLEELGLQVILVPPCEQISAPVNAHADMVIHHLGGRKLVVNNYSEQLNSALLQAGFELVFAENKFSTEYPNDIGLNFLSLGKYLLGRIDKVDAMLLKNTTATEFITTKQGYAKCSVAVVDENHVITTDRGIKKALENVGINVLLISSDGIRLDGYDCGFIGGCCGKIAADTFLITGALKALSDGDEVRRFVQNCGINIVELPNEFPLDIGSILPLKI